MTPRRVQPSDPLRQSQYKDGTNLAHRALLHDRFSINPQGWLAWLFSQLACTSQASILEVGCGPGSLWQGNAAKIAGGWALHLSDFSHGMLREARSRLATLGRLSFLLSDAQALPFQDSAFDVVLADHMLYHVPNVHRALCEIHRVLRPGARLFAATNGKNHMIEMAQLVSAAKCEPDAATARAFQASIAPFDLDTGLVALAGVFPRVETRRYPDALYVTDAEAIIRYVQSSPILHLEERELIRIRSLLTERIRADGGLPIQKDTGLLIAIKGPNRTGT